LGNQVASSVYSHNTLVKRFRECVMTFVAPFFRNESFRRYF